MPDPNDTAVSEAVGSDSNVSRPEFTDSDVSGKKPPTLGAGEQKEQIIEFLCPNGHRLHGPASLQGRPGECPDCGSRFRIPTYEEISAEEEAEQDISLGRADNREGSDVGVPAVAEAEPTPPPIGNRAAVENGATPTTISGRGLSGQAMAALVARLWDIRPKGASVELSLRDGQTVVPHQFLRKLSQQSHLGAFAVKEADGTVSLVAVAWDAVAKATLRGLNELPRGLAE